MSVRNNRLTGMLFVGYDKRKSGGHQDAFISTLKLFLLLFSICFSLYMSRVLSSEQSERVRLSTLKLFLLLVLATGTAILATLLASTVAQDRLTNRQQLKKTLRYKGLDKERLMRYLAALGLSVFYLGVVTMDMMQIHAYSSCIGVYREVRGSSTEFFREACATIALHLLRPVFCALIVAFSVKFSRDQIYFYRTAAARYILIIMVTVVAWFWLDSELTYATDLYTEQDRMQLEKVNVSCSGNDSHHHNNNNYNNNNSSSNNIGTPDHRTECLCKESDAFENVRKAGEILIPLSIEFSLLALELFLHFFFNVRDATCNNFHSAVISKEDEPGELDLAPIGYDGGIAVVLPRRMPSESEDASIVDDTSVKTRPVSVCDVTASPTSGLPNLAALHESSVVLSRRQTIVTFVGYGLSVFACVVYMSLAIADACRHSNFDHEAGLRIAYLGFIIVFFLVSIVLLLIGFHATENFKYKSTKSFGGFEMLILVTSVVMFLSKFLQMSSAVFVSHGSVKQDLDGDGYSESFQHWTVLEIVKELVGVVHVYLQTIFMFRCLCLDRPACKDPENVSYRMYKQVLLYLIFMNFDFWIVNTFAVIHNEVIYRTAGDYFTSSYGTLLHLLYPFAPFYRFNSGLVFLKMFYET